MPVKVITAATVEPMSLEEAYSHLRVTPYGSPLEHPDDADIALFISAAREWAESFTGESYAETQFEQAMDEFPDGDIVLERSPVASIESIKYIDSDGAEQTFDDANYTLDDYRSPNRIVLNDGAEWPATKDVPYAVKVLFTTAPSTDVPASVLVAIRLVLGHLYEHRSEALPVSLQSIPMGAKSHLRPRRVLKGMA